MLKEDVKWLENVVMEKVQGRFDKRYCRQRNEIAGERKHYHTSYAEAVG